LLSVNNIDVFYGDLQALRSVTLRVEEGEIVAIIGSNGAGKTTLLKTISGILHPKTGFIKLLEEDIHKSPPYKIAETVAHIPEGRRLFTKMTVLENLEMGAYPLEAWKKRDETLKTVFDLFPRLKERIKQRAGTLSGGEQQMLAIGIGIMSRPKLLMVDEASLGLAPKLVLATFETLKKINEEGTTILVAEQNIHHILEMANRAYLLENGAIALEGTGRELLNNKHVKQAYLGL
jgi:branched-chain amino acid transport system ATP-binding protein